MHAALLQFAPIRGDKESNFRKIKKLCGSTQLDLLVLPELATTGYLFGSKEELALLAEAFPGGQTSEFLTELAGTIGGHVVCGVAEKEGEILYNSAVLFSPQGHLGTYRKVHLFDKEKELFEPGNVGFPVFDLGEAKIGMMVCFDWIFPESARSLALAGAEIICHPANLVLPYCPRAALTRAIENHVFYLLSDRIGAEQSRGEELSFIGQSRILGTKGEILASLGEEEALITAEIDPSLAGDKYVTSCNHLFHDRRPDCYRLG
ncbi:MAG: acyltransferase [Candidatus Stahlbacteria bacterium]|nr:MAG: acyltransferase [Candidatus Stahlbacteria bacterium]